MFSTRAKAFISQNIPAAVAMLGSTVTLMWANISPISDRHVAIIAVCMLNMVFHLKARRPTALTYCVLTTQVATPEPPYSEEYGNNLL